MITTTADNLPRLMECNGSRLMPPSFPTIDDDPTARNEGTAAHWLAQQGFNGVPLASLIDTPAPNGFYITAEMADHVAEYLAILGGRGAMEVDTTGGGADWCVRGRADHIDDSEQLCVTDFKYGHSTVEVEQNWTLLWHAIGYCDQTGLVPVQIKLTVFQPRGHHILGKLRSWSIRYADLMAYRERIISTLSNPSDELRTGLSWCRNCHALASCPAAHAARMNSIDAAAVAFTDQLSDAALSYALDTARKAKATLDIQTNALEEMATYRLQNGAIIENYAMEDQYANTRWKPGVTPDALSIATKIECFVKKHITPAEFKRRGGSEAVYNALTERPKTSIKLIRITADQRARRLLARGNRNE